MAPALRAWPAFPPRRNRLGGAQPPAPHRPQPMPPRHVPSGMAGLRKRACGPRGFGVLPEPELAPIAISLMNIAPKSSFVLNQRHLLGIAGAFARRNRTACSILPRNSSPSTGKSRKSARRLRGRTQINLFFEVSTRTQSSFELAGKRLGADVMNMAVGQSSMRKGETLIDTAITLNAMHPDILVVRHHASGAVELLAQQGRLLGDQCRRRRA